ncbi:S8 family serine peptidase [bacterium]|nr:S8 family serine peptidase [bacterium]
MINPTNLQLGGLRNQTKSAPANKSEGTLPTDGFQKSEKPAFEEDQLLVRLREGMNLDGDSFAEAYGATVNDDLTPQSELRGQETGRLLLLDLHPGQDAQHMKKRLSNDARVEYAELNHNFYIDPSKSEDEAPPRQPTQPPVSSVPNDLQSALWGLNNQGQNGGKPDADIDAPEAWAIHSGRHDAPIVAVIDTGIDYNHPDLKANLWVNKGEIAGNGIDDDGNGVTDDVYGYNAFANTGDPLDGHSHGTHCAGTIAAVGNNGEGVVGVNQQAQVMAVKIFNNSGSTNAAAIIRGINYATQNGARITSNSWGGGAANQAIEDAFKSSPALHIMAAGNNGSDNDEVPHYPSSYVLDNNVAVAASDRADNKAKFSCYGATSVDIAAPGKDILSTIPNNSYGSKSGTSMATPHVSGVAGLVASLYPNASNEEIKTRLFEGADKLDHWQGAVVDGRRLNAHGALAYQFPAPPAPQPPAQQPPANQR